MLRLVILSSLALFCISYSATLPIASTEVLEANFSFSSTSGNSPMILAGKNDLVAFLDKSNYLVQIIVLKRNNTGQYNPFAVRNFTLDTVIDYTATDGKWISYTPRIPLLGSADTIGSCELFMVNDDGSISNYVKLDNDTVKFNYGDFLADGSFVGVSADQMYTFKETNDQWILVNVFNFTKQMRMPARVISETNTSPFFQFVGDRVVTMTNDFAEIHFYDHQANNTWSLSNVITTGATRLTAAAWNGDDTLLVTDARYAADGSTVGMMYIYQWSNDKWSLTSTLTGTDLNVLRLGSRVMSVNADTFLGTAVRQRVFLVQRNNGQWYLNGAVIGDGSTDTFASGLGFNSHDIFIAQLHGVNTVPLCSVEPMAYSCNKTELTSCTFDTFDPTVVCDYTAPQCGEFSWKLNSFGVENSLVHHVQFKLSRFGAFTASLNVSFSCPAVYSPSTGGNTNPNNGPSNGPTAGSTVPVTLTPGSSVTSSARALIASSWLIGAVLLTVI